MIQVNRHKQCQRCEWSSKPALQRGVGLLEILIALLILSIGLLGIAALQVKALSNNNSAMSRSVATIYSYSILDAMRADRVNALSGQYNVAMPVTIDGTTCIKSGATLADVQVNAWRLQIQQNMGSTACGSVNCATGTCTIVIQFDDSRASGGNLSGATQTITTEVVL